LAETDLYAPVKALLEQQGYIVKSEIRGCDVVGVRSNDAPVIVELKSAFSLQLLFQAMDRLGMTDHVYIAVARPKRGVTSSALKLCRRIGIGLIIVAASGSVEVLADPLPYSPKKNAKRTGLLLKEFAKRQGDPNLGGSGGKKLMTSYKQDALRCLAYLAKTGPSRVRDIKAATTVDRAANILRDDHYGWFSKQARGVYEMTEAGTAASREFEITIRQLGL
jgi:hypothetical protein